MRYIALAPLARTPWTALLAVTVLLVTACSRPDNPGSAPGAAGYLANGAYIGDTGEPVDKKTCSTGWNEVPKSDPKRYTCSGTVSGDGPLAL